MLVTTLAERSIDEHADAWEAKIQGIVSSSRYGGLTIVFPLGPDPDSGLHAFAHLGSGSIPRRDETTRRLVYAVDAAIALALVPGGTFSMGAQGMDPQGVQVTEAQGEHARRTGTETPWFVGRAIADLSKVPNLADRHLRAHGGGTITISPGVDGAHGAHAPVGANEPTAFGLFDIHGNVAEWCIDVYPPYPANAVTDPAVGGTGERAKRGGNLPACRTNDLGIRPARPLLT